MASTWPVVASTWHEYSAAAPVNGTLWERGTRMRTVRLAVVLPAYNEERCIERTLADVVTKLPKIARDAVIIPVNDGSTDATGAILCRLVAHYGARLVPVQYAVNHGYGGALRAGFACAVAQGADVVLVMDADGQFDVAEVARLLPLLAGHDAVFGYRLNRSEGMRRQLNAWAWKQLVGVVLGIHVRDVDCAFKLLPIELVRAADLQSEGATISAEIIMWARRMGLRWAEVGVHHYPRLAGTPTGAQPRVIARAARELLQLRRRMRRQAIGAQANLPVLRMTAAPGASDRTTP